MSQDRLPATATASAVVAVPTAASDDGLLQCEAERQVICNQQWIGADEKCRRMTCELVAGFWLLRDPADAVKR